MIQLYYKFIINHILWATANMIESWLESDGGVKDEMDDVTAYLEKVTVKDERGLSGHEGPI